jgi:hypothetical protein
MLNLLHKIHDDLGHFLGPFHGHEMSSSLDKGIGPLKKMASRRSDPYDLPYL